MARVHDQYLYADDVGRLSLAGLSSEDSARVVAEMIDNWVNRNLMVTYALRNLPKERLDIEKQVRDYRESLIIYAYETEYLSQKLDTSITNVAVEAYYRNNPSEFVLDQDIFRIRFVIVPYDAPKNDSIKVWIRGAKAEHINALEQYAMHYATKVNLNDSAWYSKADITGIFPPEFHQYLSPSIRWVNEWSDSARTYVTMITAAEIKERTAPLTYVRDQVKRVLLHKKKMEILTTLKKNIRADAERKSHFEIFKP